MVRHHNNNLFVPHLLSNTSTPHSTPLQRVQFFLYDTFLATAVISERVYGFCESIPAPINRITFSPLHVCAPTDTFINGYVQTIPYIVCFYLMSRKVDAAVMRDISFALMLVVALYSLYFGWGSAAKLRAASGNYC